MHCFSSRWNANVSRKRSELLWICWKIADSWCSMKYSRHTCCPLFLHDALVYHLQCHSIPLRICIARTLCILLTFKVSDNIVMQGTLDYVLYSRYYQFALHENLYRKCCDDMFTVSLPMLRLKWSMLVPFCAHFHVWNGWVGFFFHSRSSSVFTSHGLVCLSWFECGSHFVQVDVLEVFLQEHACSPLECLHVCVIMLLAAHVFAYSLHLKS